MSEKVSVKTRKYDLVAPDGGWGYLICVAFIINCSTVTMFIACFGILYNDFIAEIGMNSTYVTFLTGMNAICFATSGFLTSFFLKFMSLRKLCFLAVFIHNMGAVGMVFATSIPVFFLCQGIFMGSGIGIIFNLSCSILNDYFVKRRMFAFSLVQFFVAVCAMVAPIFLKWSLQEYGYRGTLLLVAGIMLHNIFGVVLMQPVKMHMKRVEVSPAAEMQPLLFDEKSTIVPSVKLTDEERGTRKQDVNVNEIIINDGKKSTIRRIAETFVDLSFAKKFMLSCACAGPAICGFADSTFSLIMPQALYALNWNQDKVALAISVYGFGDLAMRTAFIFSGRWIMKIGIQEIYVIGIILACISRLCMLWSENEIAIFFYISIMGVARCCMIVLFTMVLSEVVPAEHFTEAIGLNMLFSGLTMLCLGPAIGAIRDLTDSYDTAFYLLTSCFAIVALFWSIELCYKKNKDKRKIQKQNLEKIKSSRLNKGEGRPNVALWSENEIAIFFYISIMGVARCCIIVLFTMVLSEVVPAEHFTEAIGLNMLFSGLTMLCLGPAIGAIRDLTDSYDTAFYLLTSCYAIVALFWSIELCYKKNKDKRKIQKQNLEKIKSSRLNKGK